MKFGLNKYGFRTNNIIHKREKSNVLSLNDR